jgi:hypothetical protein
MKRARCQEACKRRLTWVQLRSSQDSEEYKGTDEAPESPCLAAPSPGTAVLGSSFSTPIAQVQALAEAERAVVKSPIVDGAFFLEGRRKARVLARLSRPAAASAAADVPQQQEVVAEDAASQPNRAPSSNDLQLQQSDAHDAAAAQCQKALAAAGSSSRGCLDLLCWGVALDQLQVAESPATPAAAGVGLLPAPPRKRSAVLPALAGHGLAVACRTARVLPGLAPADEAQLQAVRSWLAVQKVQLI